MRNTIEKSDNNSLLPMVVHCLEFSDLSGEYQVTYLSFIEKLYNFYSLEHKAVLSIDKKGTAMFIIRHF